jgi:hypothetical protein
MAFKLADLFVSIGADSSPLNKALSGIHAKLMGVAGGMGGKLGGIFSGITSALQGAAGGGMGGLASLAGIGAAAGPIGLATAALLGFGAAIGKVTMMAADLRETTDKLSSIFGSNADIITSKASEMAGKFGASKGEFMNASANFGAVLKEMGAGAGEAANTGNAIAKLGMDMASLDNTTNAEAFTAISSALRGEYDPIEKYRVFLSAAAVAQKAVSMGLADNASHVSEAAKKYATLALIVEKTKDAQGNLEETIGSGKNQWRQLQGNIEHIATSMGSVFLPIMEVVLAKINAFLGVFAKAWETFAGIIQMVYDALGMTDKAADDKKKALVDESNEKTRGERARASGTAPGPGGGAAEAKGWMGGIEQSWKHTQEAIFGKGKDAIAKDTLKEASEHTRLLKSIEIKLNRKGAEGGVGP